jgi:hypothetical protein
MDAIISNTVIIGADISPFLDFTILRKKIISHNLNYVFIEE